MPGVEKTHDSESPPAVARPAHLALFQLSSGITPVDILPRTNLSTPTGTAGAVRLARKCRYCVLWLVNRSWDRLQNSPQDWHGKDRVESSETCTEDAVHTLSREG